MKTQMKFQAAGLFTLSLMSGLFALPAAAQQAAIRVEILPTDSAGNSGLSISYALLAAALRHANYRVIQRGGAASAPDVAQSGPLGIRASVSAHSHTTQRGGKTGVFGSQMPSSTYQTTDYTVLLEVLSPDGGEVLCVGEGVGVLQDHSLSHSGGEASAFDNSAQNNLLPPAGSGRKAADDGMTETNSQTSGGVPGDISNAPLPSSEPPVPFNAGASGYGGGATGYSGGSGATPSASAAQAALRTAAQNAVLDLPRALLARAARTGSGENYRHGWSHRGFECWKPSGLGHWQRICSLAFLAESRGRRQRRGNRRRFPPSRPAANHAD